MSSILSHGPRFNPLKEFLPARGLVLNGDIASGNLFDLQRSGTSVFTVTTTGVGIGTSTPGTDKLYIKYNANPGEFGFTIENTNSSNYALYRMMTDSRSWTNGVGGSGETLFGVPNKYFIYDVTANAMRLVIDTSGNVGINTVSPTQKFSVHGNVGIFAENLARGVIVNGYSGVSVPGNYATSLYSQGSAKGVLTLGNNGSNEIRAGSSSTGGYLRIYTNNSVDGATANSDGVMAMAITSSGDVGIGTTTPVSTSNYGGLSLTGANGSILSMMTNGTETFRFATDSTGNYIQGITSLPLKLYTSNNLRLNIDNSGNIQVYRNFLFGSASSIPATHTSTAYNFLWFPGGASIGGDDDPTWANIALRSNWARGTSTPWVYALNGPAWAMILGHSSNLDCFEIVRSPSATAGADVATPAVSFFRISNTGFVGIGISSPTTNLTVAKGTSTTSQHIYNTYTDASNYERFTIDWKTTANVLRLSTEAAGTGTVRNIALIGGNLGIGTASPQAFLHSIKGSAGGYPAYGVNYDLTLLESSQDNYLHFLQPANRNGGILFDNPTTRGVGFLYYDNSTNALIIGTNSTERMRIDSSGSILVGGAGSTPISSSTGASAALAPIHMMGAC